MASYQSEFIINLSIADSMSASQDAVSEAGWRINGENESGFNCTEPLRQSSLTLDAVEVKISVVPQTSEKSKIIISASNDQFGVVYLKDKIERLTGSITIKSQQYFSTVAEQQLPVLRHVIINGMQLGNEQVKAFEQMYQVAIQDGAYWYDHLCGAWGVQGGPVIGFIQPGLNVGGPLRPDASNGNTGVFINGRQLHLLDVLALQKLGPVLPGRYWVDAWGNVGFEGWPAFANLWALSRASGSNSGGAWTANSSTGTVGGDGNGFIFFQGKDGTSYMN